MKGSVPKYRPKAVPVKPVKPSYKEPLRPVKPNVTSKKGFVK